MVISVSTLDDMVGTLTHAVIHPEPDVYCSISWDSSLSKSSVNVILNPSLNALEDKSESVKFMSNGKSVRSESTLSDSIVIIFLKSCDVWSA